MKKIVLLALLFSIIALGAFLSGCTQPNICSSNEQCKDYQCSLKCNHENFCSAGKCDCRCIQEKPECSTDSDCTALKCGIPPNMPECINGECRCKFECKTEQECKNFQCPLDCKPNYNYCDNGACTCACESAQQEYSPWELNQLKEELKGKVLKVRGVARAVSEQCSNKDCNEECCQKCSSGIELFASDKKGKAAIVLGGTYKGQEVKCTGSECSMECWPLEPESTYSVQGQWKYNKESKSYYLEPIAFILLKKGKPSFRSNKQSYEEGETVSFSFNYPADIFMRNWEPPTIEKKSGEKWVKHDTDCGCVIDCNKANPSCEKNFPECNEEACSKLEKQNAWQWNQQYCELKEVDCNWSDSGISEKVFCKETKKAEPGVYRVAFNYAESCSPTQKSTLTYSNEFEIK